jgi:hypothetical protein
MSKKVAIVGYGHLGIDSNLALYFIMYFLFFYYLQGKFLTENILNDKQNRFELVFVWNRSEINDENLDKKYILNDLNEFHK